jgi:SagB-type dehydrogenase family enzyme
MAAATAPPLQLDDENTDSLSPFAITLAYHSLSKHHNARRFARSAAMDWRFQPDPFRSYEGAPAVTLPLFTSPSPSTLPGVVPLSGAQLGEAPDPNSATVPMSLDSISHLLFYALSLSATKRNLNAQWSLRTNPSSGNLHPTECYVIAPSSLSSPSSCSHDTAVLFHYRPQDHQLEERRRFPLVEWERLTREHPEPCILVALSSILWRESWKYGERSFRYCQHDIGHALGALAYSGCLLGWTCRRLSHVGDADLTALLGLDPEQFHPHEIEYPECLLAVYPVQAAARAVSSPPSARDRLSAVIRDIARQPLQGVPNQLSETHSNFWPTVLKVQAATANPGGLLGQDPDTPFDPALADQFQSGLPPLAAALRALPATQLLRQRRSAVDFEPGQVMPLAAFCRILAATVPTLSYAPWFLHPSAHVHLVLFVHSVDGLASGLYCLVRDRAALADLRQNSHAQFSWTPVPEVPSQLPLFLLQPGDFEELAIRVSCLQEIAGDSCFSLGCLAYFEPVVSLAPTAYKELFWECGLVGQALYIAAEREGFRGTGIGCFFDDQVHDMLGSSGSLTFQSLYHFTVGVPRVDHRIQTLDPYARRSTGPPS